MAALRLARAGALSAALLIGAASALVGGTPAFAHIKIAADNAQAGARNVTVTFTGEGESSTAGIASERVVLPAGIAPADVRLVSAPPGWTFTAAADGYTVAGPALAPKAAAVHAIAIAQLPANATVLAFKTLESYSNGKVSRWIDIPDANNPDPENPAPALTLRPAAADAGPSPAVPSTTPSAAATEASSEPGVTGRADAGGSAPAKSNTPGLLIALLGVLIVAGVILAVVLRRSRSEVPR